MTRRNRKVGQFLLKKTFGPVLRATGLLPTREEFIYELTAEEAKLGASLFGPLPNGYHREFYRQDDRTWVWRESRPLSTGEFYSETTHYHLTDNGVVKALADGSSTYIRGQELDNFYQSVKAYAQRVRKLYATL